MTDANPTNARGELTALCSPVGAPIGWIGGGPLIRDVFFLIGSALTQQVLNIAVDAVLASRVALSSVVLDIRRRPLGDESVSATARRSQHDLVARLKHMRATRIDRHAVDHHFAAGPGLAAGKTWRRLEETLGPVSYTHLTLPTKRIV